MVETFKGLDIFGDCIAAVRGTDGSIIFQTDAGRMISLDHVSADKLREWLGPIKNDCAPRVVPAEGKG